MARDHMTLNSPAGSIDTHLKAMIYIYIIHTAELWSHALWTSRAAEKHLSVKSEAGHYWHESDFSTSPWPGMMFFPIHCASMILYYHKVCSWWDGSAASVQTCAYLCGAGDLWFHGAAGCTAGVDSPLWPPATSREQRQDNKISILSLQMWYSQNDECQRSPRCER